MSRQRAMVLQATCLVDTTSFDGAFSAPREVVCRHWVDPTLLATWWAPPPMTVTECVLEPEPCGRAVLEYRDAEGTYRAQGTLHSATEPERLVFDLTIANAFTATYDVTFTENTRLHVGLTITESTVDAAPLIAGLETGWTQVLDNLA